MALESFTLGDVELNDGTTFTLEGLDMPAPAKKPEWASGADSDGAILVRQPHYENRTITLKVRVEQKVTMDQAVAKVAQIVDLLQEAERVDGGLECVWTPADATDSLTFYCLTGEVESLPITPNGDDAGWFIRSPVLTIKLTCRPFGYGEEVTVSLGSSSDPLFTAVISDVPGDVPAEGRLIVTDTETVDRRHLEWGIENLHYGSGTALLIDSDDLTTSGFAGSGATRTGAYDPNSSGNNVVRATLTNVPVAVCSIGNRSHVGTFRVKARIVPVAASSSGSTIYVRFSYREGAGPLRSLPYKKFVRSNTTAEFFEVDLGVISVPVKLQGTQRWMGQIEAYGGAGDTLDVDYVAYIPAGEGYGKASAPLRLDTPLTFLRRDEFDQAAGTLSGLTAPTGGVWTGSGDSDVFSVTGTGVVTRTAVSDTSGLHNGRFAAQPSNIAATAVQIDAWTDTTAPAHPVQTDFGVLARYNSVTDFVVWHWDTSNNVVTLSKRASSTTTTIKSVDAPVDLRRGGVEVTLRLVIKTDGTWYAWAIEKGETFGVPLASGYDAAFATGGALDTGRVGFWDQHTSSEALTRYFDNFSAWAPTNPAVIRAGRAAEIRHDAAIRAESTGTYYGEIDTYRGSRFYLPPSGDEDRDSRLAVKLRRNDIDTEVDDTIDDSMSVSVSYTPRFLVVRS